MRTLITIFVFAFLLSSNSIAQTGDIVTEEKVNYLEKDKWAIIFEVGTYINTQAFESYSLSSKFHLSSSIAVRVGLGFNYTKNDATENITSGQFSKNYPADTKKISFQSSAHLIFYPISKTPVVMFVGVGPAYKYNESESGYTYVSISTLYGSSEHINSSKSKTWKAGVNVVLGAEWFVYKQISIMGEYNMSALFGKTNNIDKTTNVSTQYGTTETQDNRDGDVTEYKFNIVRLGVSVYL